jgi:abortive infection bacteriophage resistance protein
MTELDDAMKEHMAYLVYIEPKPFSYKNFVYFEVNGKSYRMKHGTFGSKISNLIQNGEVEIHVKPNLNFYILKVVNLVMEN